MQLAHAGATDCSLDAYTLSMYMQLLKHLAFESVFGLVNFTDNQSCNAVLRHPVSFSSNVVGGGMTQ